MELEKKVDEISERMNDHSLAYEILQELKESGRRWQRAFFAMLILLALTIGGFLVYLGQYDYVSTTTYEATGVYTLIDTYGNVISEDITPEMLEAAKELAQIYGEHKDNQNTNPK